MEKSKVLIIEDETIIAYDLADLLGQWGYEVVTYPEAMSAIQAALVNPPDLFLLDINMPGMDGFELCKSIKKDENLKDIPVIFISVLDEAMDKVKAFSSGAVDYITKPFQMEEVFARVTTHIKLQQFRKKFDSFAKQINVSQGSFVDLSAVEGNLIAKPLVEKEYSLDQLLDDVTEENLHTEIDTGGAIGAIN